MVSKQISKPTDSEEYKYFIEAAKKVEASNDPKDFVRAFKKVVSPKFSDHRSHLAS
jgi:hypothetical protein